MHDRVQEAAYSLLADADRKRVHLAIGQHLLENASPRELDERLFEVVDQLDLGAELLHRPASSAPSSPA